MGKRGTEVAKEAADVVLADDNFETIVRAIEGGRTIYANITKFVHMMFSHNLGEVLMIFTAIALGWPLPLLPLQILWMNLVTDVFPALALAVEPPSPAVMKQRPRDPSDVVVIKEPAYLNRLASNDDCITRPRRLRMGLADVWPGSACTNGCAIRDYRCSAWTHVQLPFAHTFRAGWTLQKSIYLGRHSHRGPAPVSRDLFFTFGDRTWYDSPC